ncbi:MAG TPA: hypothetical protein VLE47_03665 [Candidatus Saccharimonadales bacterium]|nr:hypothetical protein [Candidatus Saccharimonadales bacterium]
MVSLFVYGDRYDHIEENRKSDKISFLDEVLNTLRLLSIDPALINVIFVDSQVMNSPKTVDFLIEIKGLENQTDKLRMQIAVEVGNLAKKKFSYRDANEDNSWECTREVIVLVGDQTFSTKQLTVSV